MNTIFIINTYTLGWIIILGMTLMVISSLLQYVNTGLKSTKVLIGLVIVVLLWLTAIIDLILAHLHSINLEKMGVVALLFLDCFIVLIINQWTNPAIQKRLQRVIRWVITGATIFLCLVVIVQFVNSR